MVTLNKWFQCAIQESDNELFAERILRKEDTIDLQKKITKGSFVGLKLAKWPSGGRTRLVVMITAGYLFLRYFSFPLRALLAGTISDLSPTLKL